MRLDQKYQSLLNSYHVNTPLRIAHFMAQIEHESNLKPVSENLNYSAEGLRKTFPKYFPTIISANTNARKPQQIANIVYANRMGNGDEASGEGWKYRGRGLKQVTGKENYKKFREDYVQYFGATRDVLEQPDLLIQMPDAVRSAVWFWLRNKCYELADKGLDNTCIDAVTKVVNSGEIRKYERGGYNNASNNPVLKRREYTKLAYHAFI